MNLHRVELPDGRIAERDSRNHLYQFAVAGLTPKGWEVAGWRKNHELAVECRRKARHKYSEVTILQAELVRAAVRGKSRPIRRPGDMPAHAAQAATKGVGQGGTTSLPFPRAQTRSEDRQPLDRMALKQLALRASAEEDYSAAWRLEMAAGSLAPERYRHKHIERAERYINRCFDPALARKQITLTEAVERYDYEGVYH